MCTFFPQVVFLFLSHDSHISSTSRFTVWGLSKKEQPESLKLKQRLIKCIRAICSSHRGAQLQLLASQLLICHRSAGPQGNLQLSASHEQLRLVAPERTLVGLVRHCWPAPLWDCEDELGKSPSSAVLKDKQDVLISPIAAPSLLKITDGGAAHPWKTHIQSCCYSWYVTKLGLRLTITLFL